MPFAEVLEAVDTLSLEEQETLINILYRRLVHKGRTILIGDVQEARKELSEGRCKVVTIDELMEEIQS